MYYHPFYFYDLIEITFYACLFYSFCLWLKADKTKNLLGYFLGYCSIILSAWFFGLPTLPTFLSSYAPAILIIFIILHEKTLQRNFVALSSLSPHAALPEDWIEPLLGALIMRMNNNKSCTLIIEKNDALAPMFITEIALSTPVNKEILHVLLTSRTYRSDRLLWLTSKGYIKGMNATFKEQPQSLIGTHSYDDINMYTLLSDAFIIHADCSSHLFSITSQGKTQSAIPVQEIKNCIKKHISANTNQSTSKRIAYENNDRTKNNPKQPHP